MASHRSRDVRIFRFERATLEKHARDVGRDSRERQRRWDRQQKRNSSERF